MKPQQEQEPTLMEGNRKFFNLFLFLCAILAKPVEVILRKPGTVGKKYFGTKEAALALVGIPLVGGLALSKGQYASAGIGIMLVIYIVRLVQHNITRALLSPEAKAKLHSFASGVSVFEGWPFSDPRKTRVYTEPFVCIVLGAILREFCGPIGMCIAVGGVAAGILRHAADAYETSVLEAMRDAELESRYFAERYRSEKGEEE